MGFSRLSNTMTMARTIKLYKLPDKCAALSQEMCLLSVTRRLKLSFASF